MRIEQRPLPATLPDLGDMPPLLTRLYAARGIQTPEELDKSLARLIPAAQMKGISEAIELLVDALEKRQRILIVGDFDCDGATATTIGVLALRAMGAEHVDYLVPNRFEYGYGLTPEIVAVALERQPELLITVDNGISSIDGVAAAKAAGLRVLVTDHHLPASELPAADAIVNPNQPGCAFPSKALAGCGVIYYVMLSLRGRLRSVGWFARRGIAEPNLGDLLDIVALGTVADVVPLDANNRILVHQGIARIRAGRARPGILALLKVGRREHARVSAMDMGFIAGPRLNAAGRLSDMSLGIECLLCDDPDQAFAMATELDDLNKERRAIEQDIRDDALAQIDNLELDDLPFGLCLFDESWHQGVIGIVASRLKEKYNRPALVFADAGGDMVKGSGRSVPGFHLRDALDAIAARHPGLLRKFGGHAMAAGMTIERERFAEFSLAFDQEVRRHLSADDLSERLVTDGELNPEDFQLEVARGISQAGPWGQQFPQPLFHGMFEVIAQKVVGEKHVKLVLKTPGKGVPLEAIAFNVDREAWPNEDVSQVQLAYRLDINLFREKEILQLVVESLEAA
ncbi:single-stranded-DNA-specific exonuclease RecJ [Geopseudomonas aromaticivorans]